MWRIGALHVYDRKISLRCIIINVTFKYPCLNSFFFFLSLCLHLSLLPPPCLELSATFCGLETFQPASLSCSVVLFRRFHLPPHRCCRLTAKLRYENKQLALELTGEKKSATNAPSQPPLHLLVLSLTAHKKRQMEISNH